MAICEGSAENVEEVLEAADVGNYKIMRHKTTGLDKIIGFLLNPVVSGILIMILVGGIYFELQSPGIGFPLGAAVVAAILYFAPLYLEGLAENWEIVIFIIGLLLIAVEIFAIPGFGVAGILGIILVVAGLTLAMVDNIVFELEWNIAFSEVIKRFFIVISSMFLSLILSLFLGKQLFTNKALRDWHWIVTWIRKTDSWAWKAIRRNWWAGQALLNPFCVRPAKW